MQGMNIVSPPYSPYSFLPFSFLSKSTTHGFILPGSCRDRAYLCVIVDPKAGGSPDRPRRGLFGCRSDAQ